MEKLKRMFRNEQGFTLIEIIVVLIILGILAAVIMPKYFDLGTEAGKKAAIGVIAELQARGNLLYANTIMKGEGISEYVAQEDKLLEGLTDNNPYFVNWSPIGSGSEKDVKKGSVSVNGAEVVTFEYTLPVFSPQSTGSGNEEDELRGPEFRYDKPVDPTNP